MVDQKQALGQKVYTLIKKWTLPRPVKVVRPYPKKKKQQQTLYSVKLGLEIG